MGYVGLIGVGRVNESGPPHQSCEPTASICHAYFICLLSTSSSPSLTATGRPGVSMAAVTTLMAIPLRPFNSIPYLRQPAPKWPPHPSLVSNSIPTSRFRTMSRLASRRKAGAVVVEEGDENLRRGLHVALWTAEGIYVLWLFLLPYAPGDPVWAISPETISEILGLSLNFFFVLPFMNAAGIRLIEAPVFHPVSEGLFNFVIGWTLMFAPLLFTDFKRDRYKWSLDVLWGLQMFLTNTFLIPYMAIRLNKADTSFQPRNRSALEAVMTDGASIVGLIGAGVCLISVVWALFGRMDGNFGNIADRLQFLVSYMGSERLAYAFLWDLCLYTIFQPWLIMENLQNVEKSKASIVKYLSFLPVIGLTAYLLFLDVNDE